MPPTMPTMLTNVQYNPEWDIVATEVGPNVHNPPHEKSISCHTNNTPAFLSDNNLGNATKKLRRSTDTDSTLHEFQWYQKETLNLKETILCKQPHGFQVHNEWQPVYPHPSLHSMLCGRLVLEGILSCGTHWFCWGPSPRCGTCDRQYHVDVEDDGVGVGHQYGRISDSRMKSKTRNLCCKSPNLRC